MSSSGLNLRTYHEIYLSICLMVSFVVGMVTEDEDVLLGAESVCKF